MLVSSKVGSNPNLSDINVISGLVYYCAFWPTPCHRHFSFKFEPFWMYYFQNYHRYLSTLVRLVQGPFQVGTTHYLTNVNVCCVIVHACSDRALVVHAGPAIWRNASLDFYIPLTDDFLVRRCIFWLEEKHYCRDIGTDQVDPDTDMSRWRPFTISQLSGRKLSLVYSRLILIPIWVNDDCLLYVDCRVGSYTVITADFIPHH